MKINEIDGVGSIYFNLLSGTRGQVQLGAFSMRWQHGNR